MNKNRKPKSPDHDGQAQLKLGGLDAMEWMPRCEKTGSNIDLHLVAYQDPDTGAHTAGILGSDYRHLVRKSTSLSIPIWTLSVGSLRALERRNKIPPGTRAATELTAWLRQGIDLSWQSLSDARDGRQTTFDLGDAAGLGL